MAMGDTVDKTKLPKINIKIGGGLMGPLLAVFITLKLLGQIDWSWWWVTSPVWLPITVVLGVGAVLVVGTLLVTLVVALIAALLDR
jgi:hypothetical protein